MTDDKSNELHVNDIDIDAVVARLEGNASSQAKPLIRNAIDQLKRGRPLQEALNFTPEILEAIYQHGYHVFQSGKYPEALSIFQLLRELNPTDSRYTFAIAATHHFTKNYSEAAAYYIIYGAMNSQDPIPFYHLYDCFLKTNHPDIAENALEEAYRLAKRSPKHQDLKEKIELELKNVNPTDDESSIPINKEIKG